MKKALSTQVGGSHYKGIVLQPILLSYAVANGDSCFTKVAKYVTRDKGANKEDINKAAHICMLAGELQNCSIASTRDYARKTDLALIAAFAGQYKNEEFVREVLVWLYEGDYSRASELCLKSQE